jgi:hypothetical protein
MVPMKRMNEIVAVAIKTTIKMSQSAEENLHFMLQIFGHIKYLKDRMNVYKCSAYYLILCPLLLLPFP